MSKPKASGGLTFAESMRGWFALDETDPVAGSARGREAANELVLDVRINIEDLPAFLADPQHRGGLQGSVWLESFGGVLAGSQGVFQLFAPGGEEASKLMVYELALQRGGEDYYFAGRKRITPGNVLSLWPETTTLYSTIHRGSSSEAEVMGAGILRLGVPQLLRMLTAFRPLSSGLLQAPANMARFGTFFTKELWRSYVLSQASTDRATKVAHGAKGEPRSER